MSLTNPFDKIFMKGIQMQSLIILKKLYLEKLKNLVQLSRQKMGKE